MNKKSLIITFSLLAATLLSSCNSTPSVTSSSTPTPSETTSPSTPISETTSPSVSIDTYYNIYLNQTNGGLISVDKLTAKAGEMVTISSICDDGYELLHYLVDETIINGNTFMMPSKDVNVSALFHDGYYDIELIYNENLYFDVTSKTVKYGEEVVIDYMPITNYVLDHFLINGVAISGDTFIMPKEDVVIEGVVSLAYKESDIAIDIHVQGRDQFYTRSNWFFEYGEDGLYITSYIYDHFIVDDPYTVPDKGYRDNVEIIVSPLENITGLSIYNSINVMVSVDGDGWYRRASSQDEFMFEDMPDYSYFRYSSTIHRYLDKQGFNGYVVTIFLSYSLWGLNYDNASFVIMPSHRNTINYPYKTYWDHLKTGDEGSTEYLDISTHPLLNRDGTISENPYKGAN